MIPASLLSSYRGALNVVGDAAKQSLQSAYVDAVAQGLSERAIREVMVEAAWNASTELGNLASSAAADFYERIRFDQLPDGLDFQARLAELPDFARIEEQAHMSARFLYDRDGTEGRVYAADPQAFLNELTANIERLIMDVARETIMESARHDNVQPRVVVSAQAGACDFCMDAMLAGWTRPARAAQEPNIFHDHCRCFTVPSWEKHPEIGGVGTLRVNRPTPRNIF